MTGAALVKTDQREIERAAAQGALPAISAEMMVAALTTYRDLQHNLDKAMPDQIMQLDGKPFRKKGYWRAVALAFNLSVDPVEEKRIESGSFKDGRANFGWVVTYRANHPTSGRSQTGDGACFAIEKARRFKCPHPEAPGSRRTVHFPHNTCPDFDPDFSWRALPNEATEHNVRSHAHTRAYNRAVSNLVGFGEVSAEEVERDDDHQEPAPATSVGRGKTEAASTAPTASQTAQPAASLAPGTTTVASVAVKQGKSARGAWTRYYVKFDDGRDGVTFDNAIGTALQAAQKDRTPVHPELETTGKGTDLKRLLPIVPAEPVHTDEPVDGPEKILTVRKVTTDAGDRWIIQTEKRQLVTDREGHADQATRARADKLGVTPKFETIPSRAGGPPVHRLLEMLVDTAEPTERTPGEEG